MSERHAVLWVGDDRETAASLPTDLEVVHATGAADALTRLAEERFACVACPLELPDIGVAEFVELLREEDPDLPVVLVGDDHPETVRDALAAGATAQVTVEGLADRLRREVARKRSEASLDRHAALRSLVADVAADVAGAETRKEAEQVVYERLAASELYRYVWVGEYDDGQLRLGAPVEGQFEAEEVSGLVGSDSVRFLERAAEAGEVTVTRGSVETRSATARGTSGGAGALSTAAVPLTAAGGVAGLVIVSSARPDAFDAIERDALAGLGSVVAAALPDGEDLQGDLVHELRNPLGAALAHLELAREGDEEALERLEESLERIQWTVDNVLADPAQEPLDAGGVDLAEAAESAWERIDSDDATLLIEDSTVLEADSTLLDRLLSNLFRNAVEHGSTSSRSGADDEFEFGDPDTLDGSHGLTVRVGTTDRGFYVEDNGPGIPEDDREHVFERGYTVGEGGMGVGLSLVERIADRHGWTVSVTDADPGARFEVAVR